MKNRSLNAFLLLFWLIPGLACNSVSSEIATPTAVTRPEVTATAKSTGAATGKFGPITFSASVLRNNNVFDPVSTFPDGLTGIYAIFDYSGLQDGQAWHSEWKHDGQVQPDLSYDGQWKGSAIGVWEVSIYDRNGVKTGEWELNLYLGSTLEQTAKTTVEPNPVGQPDFGPVTIALDKDAQNKPVNALEAPFVPLNTSLVYAFFDGIDVPKGTNWTSQWLLDGQPTIDPEKHIWDLGPSANEWIRFGTPDNSPLTSGTYELKLAIGSRLVNIATFRVL